MNNTVQNQEITTITNGQPFKKTKDKLDYVTSAQGRIYIGGVLIDECYDIQYTYQESKEPIYGYNSKYWDHVLDGNVIIYGSFTINYKHDKYLLAILKSLGNDRSVSGDKTRQNNMKKLAEQYADKLRSYKAQRDQLEVLKKELASLQSESKEIEGNILLQQENIKDATNNHIAIINGIETQRNDLLDNVDGGDSGREALMAKYDNFNALIDDPEYKNGGGIVQAQEELVTMNNHYNKQIADTMSEINDLKVQLDDLQFQLDEFNNNNLSAGGVAEPYNSSMDIINNLEEQINLLQQEIDNKQTYINDIEGEKDYTSSLYMDMAKQEDEKLKGQLDADPNLKGLVELDTKMARAEVNQEKELKDLNDVLTGLQVRKENVDAKVVAKRKQKESKDVDVQAVKGQIATLKEDQKKAAAEISTLLEFEKFGGAPTAATRAEDMGHFNIFIEFNGLNHKILQECTLTGHSHAIAVSGVPVKEQYNFIAKKFA